MRLNAFRAAAMLVILAACPPAGAAGAAGAAGVDPGEEIISVVTAMGIAPPGVPPNRGSEAQGPYKRLIIKNATIIDGTGAPAQGPVNILIENDRIVALSGRGTGSLPVSQFASDAETRVIDATGKFVLPGFIDTHVHTGTPTHAIGGGVMTDPEYVLKLWLAHGVTTVRDVGSIMGLKWTLDLKRRSEKGEISAPRIQAFSAMPETMSSPGAARAWVRSVRQLGADGVKFLGAPPEVIRAAVDEAHKLGMKTAYHHSQVSVTRINALDSARMGLDSLEHWYGLPEVMFEDRRIQAYPNNYLYNDEQDRFREAGRLWLQAAAPGSEKWKSTLAELISPGLTLSPTFTAYDANRDAMRARTAEWFGEYTMPYVAKAFEPNPAVHGSYFFDWTTADEIAWKANFRRWMTFVNDYKNAGGRVTTGSDSGFIYNVYGFGFVRELELLQEAGFHPLEVVRSATLNGAELLGIDKETGTIEAGKKADLVIVDENPLGNFKVLFGTGNPHFNMATGKVERTSGIRYTIKDGVVFDARELLAQVRTLVANEKAREAKSH
jgi:imidazolonepropionase-like amidohydrolase